MREPPFSLVVRAFLLREMREAASYKAALLLRVGALLLALASLHFLARFIASSGNAALAPYGSSYLGFVLLGFILTEIQQVAIQSFAQRVRWAQIAGTLEAMLATPAKPWQILLAAPIGDFLEALLRAGGYLLLGSFFFGLHLANAHVGVALLAWALAVGAFVGFGLLAAAASMFFRKNEPIGWAISGLSVLVSGVIYPTSVLPGWLRSLGGALPLTHVLEAVRRAILGGATLAELSRSLVFLGGFFVVLVPLGLVAFTLALRRARVDGSLTHY